jgi:hypothetical protein
MNVGRLALAAVTATVVDAVYGFTVYGTLLSSRFSALPNVYRQGDDAARHMAFIFVGTLVAALAAAYIYTKGYEGGSGLTEGLSFGFVIGLFAAGYAGIVNFATLNIDLTHGLVMAAAALVEWIIAGMVIGLIYKPAPRGEGVGAGRV